MKQLFFLSFSILVIISCKKDPKEPKPNLGAGPNDITIEATIGSIDSFSVSANLNWTLAITSGNNWMQASTSSGGTGTTKITITTTETNFGNTPRTGTITVSPATAGIVPPVVITVLQESKFPTLLVSSNTITMTGIKGETLDSFQVRTNLDWTITTSASWIGLTALNGSNDKYINFTATEDNFVDSTRTGTITVTPVGTTLVPPQIITVKQKQWYSPQGGTNGTDHIAAVAKTADGNLIFAGSTSSNGPEMPGGTGQPSDYWLLKTDINGKMLWQKAFGTGLMEYALGVATGTDGSYVMAGYTDDNASVGTIWLVKTDANGNKLWDKTFNGNGWERANAIMATSDNGYLITGTTGGSTTGDFSGSSGKEMFLLKIDAAGNKQWIKYYGGGHEVAYAMAASPDGGYVLAGYTMSNSGDVTGNPTIGMYAWIVKTNASGDLVWQRLIPHLNLTTARAITPSGDGGYIVAGFVVKPELSDNGMSNDEDLLVVKLNSDGSIAWQKQYGGTHQDRANAITPTQGGFICTGITWSNNSGDVSGFSGIQDMWVLKIDNSGNKVWQKTIGGTYFDEASCIVPLANNTYIIAGNTQSGKLNFSGTDFPMDGLLIKIKD